MDRKEFFEKTMKIGICSCGLMLMNQTGIMAVAEGGEDELEKVKKERDFILNWLTDLRESMDKHLDENTKALLLGDCGAGCFKRHKFKSDMPVKAQGDLNKLLEAYKENFEAWIDGDLFHIRFGEVNKFCYCPVGRNLPNMKNDIHCECTRGTHQAIFETAFNRPFKVEMIESVKRGGKTCHLLVHLKS